MHRDFLKLVQRSLNGDEELVQSISTDDHVVDRGSIDGVEKVVERLNEIIEQIKVANDLGSLSADERDLVVAELEAGTKLLGVQKVRLGSVRALISRPLRWLADKTMGAGINQMVREFLTNGLPF